MLLDFASDLPRHKWKFCKDCNDNIQVILKNEHGMQAVAIEGKGSGQWILMDYGNTIIHVFSDQIRDYYALESLWPKAKFVAQKDEALQSEA